jgi:hypothetical protein
VLALKSGTIGCAYACNENKSATGKKNNDLNSEIRLTDENRTGKRNRLTQGASTNLLKCKTVFMVYQPNARIGSE